MRPGSPGAAEADGDGPRTWIRVEVVANEGVLARPAAVDVRVVTHVVGPQLQIPAADVDTCIGQPRARGDRPGKAIAERDLLQADVRRVLDIPARDRRSIREAARARARHIGYVARLAPTPQDVRELIVAEPPAVVREAAHTVVDLSALAELDKRV